MQVIIVCASEAHAMQETHWFEAHASTCTLNARVITVDSYKWDRQ